MANRQSPEKKNSALTPAPLTAAEEFVRKHLPVPRRSRRHPVTLKEFDEQQKQLKQRQTEITVIVADDGVGRFLKTVAIMDGVKSILFNGYRYAPLDHDE